MNHSKPRSKTILGSMSVLQRILLLLLLIVLPELQQAEAVLKGEEKEDETNGSSKSPSTMSSSSSSSVQSPSSSSSSEPVHNNDDGPDVEQIAIPVVEGESDSTKTSATTTAKDLEEVRRQYWKRTFDEIRNIGSGGVIGQRQEQQQQLKEGNVGADFLSQQWKLFTSSSAASPTSSSSTSETPKQQRRRFEGFVSWERLLQDWADDVQEYIEKNAQEAAAGTAEYPFASFGRTSSSKTQNLSAGSNAAVVVMNDTATTTTTATNSSTTTTGGGSSSSRSKRNQEQTAAVLPIPAPAKPGEAVLPHTDISDKSKNIWIVTTAALPWRTGTAVNPILRAAYLTHGRKEAGGSVTIMLPWLERQDDQDHVYGKGNTFATPADQEQHVRDWLLNSANMTSASQELKIEWYTGWQNKIENSIYSMGDITALIPEDAVDICILEEPEHLNWYRAPGESWTRKFKHVVGILHTNYFQYAMDQPAALIRAPGMKLLCSWMCRAHCHRVIKLSGTLGNFAPEKELVENVHGVRGTFIDVGTAVRDKILQSSSSIDNDGESSSSNSVEEDPIFGPSAEPTVYFIGKLLWSKGLGSLMELLKYAEESADLKVKVDMYGGGPDQKAAELRSLKLELDMPFHGPLDHAELAFTHKVFVNPSTSEVLCTTSAEALAMGKFVILPSHPSNDFFAQFPNCLVYTTKDEFVANLYYAMTHSPEPLSEEYAYALSWEAATERLEAAGCIPVEEAEQMEKALASSEASIEISLPPLVESEESRHAVARTLIYTRDRYRQFRTRLSNEIQQSTVLPKFLRDRLLSDLDKRLDLNIEEMLASPKLRVKLSPAELDKSLLDLYDKVSDSPSGDLLRLISGGGRIALQNMYIRQKAQKQLHRRGILPEFLPSLPVESETKETYRSATQWVRLAMRKNLPSTQAPSSSSSSSSSSAGNKKLNENSEDTLRMSVAQYTAGTHVKGFKPYSSFTPKRPLTMSLLI